MPEVILCKYCKQPINKETDQYVVVEKVTDRYPEALVHVACEQSRSRAFGLEEWARMFRWPSRP
jgi:hypothetical protein